MLPCSTAVGTIRYRFMRDILDVLRDRQTEAEEIPVEVAVAMPPRESVEFVEKVCHREVHFL